MCVFVYIHIDADIILHRFSLVLGAKILETFFKFPAKLDVCKLLLRNLKYLYFTKIDK